MRGVSIAVDKAEVEAGPAMAVNGVAPGILAEEGETAVRATASLLHGFNVFDGTQVGRLPGRTTAENRERVWKEKLAAKR